MGFLDYLGEAFGTSNNGTIDKSIATLDDILSEANNVSTANKNLYNRYMSDMQGTYGANANQYQSAVDQLAEAIANRGDFSYNGNVNDFYDPAANQRASAAMGAINNASASGGNRFSSNYIDKVAAKQQALASEEWRNAYDRMMQDRQQNLSEWQTGQEKINNMGTLAGLYGQDRNALSEAVGNYYENMANQNNANLSVMSDITGNKANLNAQRSNGMGSLLGGIGSIIGGIFG